MKKYLFILLLFSNFGGIAQPQRLALLPIALNVVGAEASQASTLCIDYFRPVPTKQQTLSYISGEGASGEFTLRGRNTYSHATIKGHRGSTEGISFFGSANANKDIPEYYQNFIKQRTQAYENVYKNRAFTKQAHLNLQYDIWEFNILDNLGYINRRGDPTSSFNLARDHFKTIYNGQYTSALELGSDITRRGASHSAYQSISQKKFNNYIVHYEKGTYKYCVFDGEGHIMFTSNSSESAIAGIINDPKIDANDNVYLTTLNFENNKKSDAFMTSANMEGFKSNNKISFERYMYQDVCSGGKRYSIPHRYGEADIESTGNRYYFFESKFKEKTNYLFKNIEVDTYSTSKPVLSEMITDVNETFQIGDVYNQVKENISVASFLHKFKKQVKRIHNLQSAGDLVIVVKYQLKPVGYIKFRFRKNDRSLKLKNA